MSPKLLAVMIALGLFAAGCSASGGSDATTTTTSSQPAASARLVVWNEEEIGIVTDGDIIPVDSSGSISQVTASRDGALVWTSLEDAPRQVRAVIENGTRIELDTPTVPFFYEWDPTGSRVAFLGNSASGAGLVFGVIDVATETLTPVESPAPFFFDWSPDGERLIAHVGGTSLGIIDASNGEVDDLGQDSGMFSAPVWTEEGIVVVTEQGPTVSGELMLVAYQPASSQVVLVDPDDRTELELASIEGPVRFFPGSEALALVVGTIGSQRIEIVDWAGEPITTIGSGTIDVAQWSPDGATLLWTERRGDGDLEPKTWSGGETIRYDPFAPSRVFGSAYVPFWDQYDRAMSVWSPNSASFMLPTQTEDGPVVLVQELDGSSLQYPGWDMAAWVPSGNG